MSSSSRDGTGPSDLFGVRLPMLKAAMKNPDQSIGQRSQRLVMGLAAKAKSPVVTPSAG
jgi:hypothetical protein